MVLIVSMKSSAGNSSGVGQQLRNGFGQIGTLEGGRRRGGISMRSKIGKGDEVRQRWQENEKSCGKTLQ